MKKEVGGEMEGEMEGEMKGGGSCSKIKKSCFSNKER